MNLTCPTDGKDYILPTKHWLSPLKEIILDDISKSHSKFILSNFITSKIKKNEILVKLSSGRNHKMKEFTKKMKDLPNLVNIYCVLFCKDDFLLIKEHKQFCSLEDDKPFKDIKLLGTLPEKAKKYNYSVTLELMEYYKNGSFNTIGTINLTSFMNIFLQLTFCQLNLFSFLGYTHNDIHEGNILIKKHETIQLLDYIYIAQECIDPKKKYKLKTDIEYILSDYDRVFSFEYKYFIEEFENIIKSDNKNSSENAGEFNTFSLYSNIMTTINMIANKLSDIDKTYIKSILFQLQEKYENRILSNMKDYIMIYYKDKNYTNFKKNIKFDICRFIKKFITKISIIK